MSGSPRSAPLRLLLLSLFAAALLPACVIYDEEADVRAHWTFAGQGCAQAGVALVQVVFEEQRGSDIWDSRLIPCEDGWVEFAGMDPGRYWVTALGFPRTGDYATWDLDLSIEIHPGFNEFTLELVPVGSF